MPVVRAKSNNALLIIDVTNDLSFSGGEKVEPWTFRAAQRIGADVKARLTEVQSALEQVAERFSPPLSA